MEATDEWGAGATAGACVAACGKRQGGVSEGTDVPSIGQGHRGEWE